MGEQLSAREEAILLGLLMNFVKTRGPVASKRLAEECAEGISPATVRGILGRLEEAGYLSQPHSSAGRVPTDRAYRYLAERVLSQAVQEADPDWEEVERLSADGSLNAVARQVSHTLAWRVRGLGFAVTPSARELRLRSCELVRLSAERVLWVVVSQAGQVLEAVLPMHEVHTHEELRWFSNYLSSTYAGRSFSEIRLHLQSQIGAEEADCRREIRQAMALVAPYFMGQDPERELFWDGAAWLLETPELAGNLAAVRSLLESLQRKSQLLDLLDTLTREPGGPSRGMRVVLGDDWPDPAVRGLAMVLAPFGSEPAGLGVLGIIGSQSLRYDTTIPMVRRVARLATLASARL